MAIKIDVIVDIDPNLMTARAEKADETLAIQVEKDTRQFAPARSNKMLNGARVEGGTITYPGPYAGFLWRGKVMIDPDTGSPWARPGATKVATSKDLVFSTDVSPMPQSHWIEPSAAVNMPTWLRVYGKAMTSG